MARKNSGSQVPVLFPFERRGRRGPERRDAQGRAAGRRGPSVPAAAAAGGPRARDRGARLTEGEARGCGGSRLWNPGVLVLANGLSAGSGEGRRTGHGMPCPDLFEDSRSRASRKPEKSTRQPYLESGSRWQAPWPHPSGASQALAGAASASCTPSSLLPDALMHPRPPLPPPRSSGMLFKAKI